jgi:hypothetical protein
MNSPEESNSDSSIADGLDIKTPAEILILGLELLGFTEKRINRKSKNKNKTQQKIFIGNFGAGPHVVAQIWEDLQKTEIDDAYLPPNERSFPHLLYVFHFMKAYPTEDQRVGKWHECDRILRDKGGGQCY